MSTAEIETVLQWCHAVLGSVQLVADDTRSHPGLRAGAMRLRTPTGDVYLKLHRDPAHWNSEVHAYEQWARAFGGHAPRLLAVHDGTFLAVIISILPGKIMDDRKLPIDQEQEVWRAAGRALAALHEFPHGACFGPCWRDGSPAGPCIADPQDYLNGAFAELLERGEKMDWLSPEERLTVHAVLDLIPAFAGERPVACHRDYCPANWLVNESGAWSGVIDFEFAYWDIRAADLSRFPNWEWLFHPELFTSFMEGYGKGIATEQLWCSRALYALGAVVWGMENSYFGFVSEGRTALQSIGSLLR